MAASPLPVRDFPGIGPALWLPNRYPVPCLIEAQRGEHNARSRISGNGTPSIHSRIPRPIRLLQMYCCREREQSVCPNRAPRDSARTEKDVGRQQIERLETRLHMTEHAAQLRQ